MQHQQRRLSNGVRVELIHDAQATCASALWQVDVGSHHEPDAWPGLAHLLEHLLFAGSEAFRDAQRLMAWLPAQGGRLNATTQGSSTAYFFECAPQRLAEALARLTDMLAAPLLTATAIRQEVATLDAECRLLASHQDTLCDAALSHTFASHPWQRFQTGNAAGFGNDESALRTALQQFHQRYYHGANLTLRLQGPQPIDELWQLAQGGEVFAAGGDVAGTLPALVRECAADGVLQLSGAPRLRLCWLVNRQLHGGVALLRQLLLDEAPGSLMAALRGHDLCDGVRLLLPYCSAQQTLITIELVLTGMRHAVRAGALVHHWLRLLTTLTPAQRSHAARLARRQFSRLAVMDQLRERATGFAPVPAEEDAAAALFALLPDAPLSRLWISDEPQAERFEAQGWTLHGGRVARAAVPPDAMGAVLNLSPPLPPAMPALPVRRTALEHLRRDRHPAVLLLSPAGDLPAPQGHILQARLRELAAACVHQDGELAVSCQQGRWLIQIQGEAGLMVATLGSLNSLLRDIPAAIIVRGTREYQHQQQARHDDIALRALLGALPEQLLSWRYPADPAAPPLTQPWRAVLEGGDAALHDRLARLLSEFPGCINPPQPTPPAVLPPQATLRVSTASPEAALLRFCPLVEESRVCLAAWQLLAMIYAPLFFQRLRVEQNIGYAVSCRFYQAAGLSGILFALQSPHLSIAALSARIDAFLAEMGAVLATQSAEALAEKCRALLAEQVQMPSGVLESSRQRWTLAQQIVPLPTAEDLRALTPERLRDYHQRLLVDRARACQVINHPFN